MAQRKVMDIHIDGVHLECIRHDDKKDAFPFRIYKVVANHRNLLMKYADFLSVVRFINSFYLNGLDTLTLPEIRRWIKEQMI